MRVLVTRPQQSGQITQARLQSLGFEAISTPLFKLKTLPEPAQPHTSTNAFVITSANGARAFLEASWHQDFLQHPFYLVGDTSAQLLEQAGAQQIKYVAKHGKELIKAINLLPDQHLVYLSGFHHSMELTALKSSHVIDVIELYRADPDARQLDIAKDHILAGRIDAILIYSARAAKCIATEILNPKNHDKKVPHTKIINHMDRLRLYCLSKNIADILVEYLGPTHPTISWPDMPTEEALLALLPLPS